MPSEAAIRQENIDKQLVEAGWIRSQGNVVTEMFLPETGKGIRESYQDYLSPAGAQGSRAFADYVLLGKDGKPLAVLEAKRDSRSPLEGERQAIEYAQRISQQTGKSRGTRLGANLCLWLAVGGDGAMPGAPCGQALFVHQTPHALARTCDALGPHLGMHPWATIDPTIGLATSFDLFGQFLAPLLDRSV